jgi:hypothetical protein
MSDRFDTLEPIIVFGMMGLVFALRRLARAFRMLRNVIEPSFDQAPQ